MGCLAWYPGLGGGCQHRGNLGSLGLLRAQLARKMSRCAPATCSPPVFAGAEEFLVLLGQACAYRYVHVHLHTHVSLAPIVPHSACLAGQEVPGHSNFSSATSGSLDDGVRHSNVTPTRGREEKEGDGSVSEASTHQGCARQLSPSTAVTAAAIEVAKAASATTNASDPSERCR